MLFGLLAVYIVVRVTIDCVGIDIVEREVDMQVCSFVFVGCASAHRRLRQ